MALDLGTTEVGLNTLEHRNVFGNGIINVDHSAETVSALRALRIDRTTGDLVGIDDPPKAGPDLWRLSDKDVGSLQKGLEVDKVLDPEVDEFQELVIGRLVVDKLLDLVEQGNIFGRSQSLG